MVWGTASLMMSWSTLNGQSLKVEYQCSSHTTNDPSCCKLKVTVTRRVVVVTVECLAPERGWFQLNVTSYIRVAVPNLNWAATNHYKECMSGKIRHFLQNWAKWWFKRTKERITSKHPSFPQKNLSQHRDHIQIQLNLTTGDAPTQHALNFVHMGFFSASN